MKLLFILATIFSTIISINSQQNILYSFFNITNNSTCAEVESCLNNSTDPAAVKLRCEAKVNECDDNCLQQAPIFENCISNCNCLNSTDVYPWTCIDECKSNLNNTKYVEIVDCFYSPCRVTNDSLNVGIIILIALLALTFIIIAGVLIYKWRVKKNTPILADSNYFTKINP